MWYTSKLRSDSLYLRTSLVLTFWSPFSYPLMAINNNYHIFSKWPVAELVKNKRAETVADYLYSMIIIIMFVK